jgi:hypothetical protein
MSLLVPEPDYIILLTGSPEKIHDRKPELSVRQITNQLGMMSDKLSSFSNVLTFDSILLSPDEISREIMLRIQEDIGPKRL